MKEIYIKKVSDARACIGSQVWWDDYSSRYVCLRTGIIDEVQGGNINIEGNWMWRNDLRNLRNFEKGGAFKEPAQ